MAIRRVICALIALILAQAAHAAPKIEVCFVLDTTGSMAAMVEGAKRKIWAIANEVVKLTPRPQVSFCLVAFRDRGDDYVTRVTPLSSDLDAVYEELVKLEAAGGGDTPEAVNQALYDALTGVAWTAGPASLKLIYLTGDAPGHVGRAGEPQLEQIMQLASAQGVIVNAIQCGNLQGTDDYWQHVVELGGGQYAQVAQSGNVEVVTTVLDQDFASLQAKLDETLLVYGDDARRERIVESRRSARRADAAVLADRLSFYARLGRVLEGDGDLIEDLRAGKIKLQDIPLEQLPESLRTLGSEQRRARIEELSADRAEYQRVVAQLIAQRDILLRVSPAADASFDRQVITQLQALWSASQAR